MAGALLGALEARGMPCWIAPRDIPPGADWAGEIVRAIKDAAALVLVFTIHSNASKQVLREVQRAADRETPIVPLRFEEVAPSDDLEFYLGAAQWLDALARPLEPHLARIADGVRAACARSAAETPRAAAWVPAQERILAELTEDLTRYADLSFRLQAAFADSSRVISRSDTANRTVIQAAVAYNEFGPAFVRRISRYRTAIRKFWGPDLADEFAALQSFVEELYRGRVFDLNGIRIAVKDLKRRPDAEDEEYARLDREKAGTLDGVRRALAELSSRSDAFLRRLARIG